MPGKLQPLSQKDFSGGVNAVSSPFNLKENQIQRGRNLLLDEQGALTTRDGYVIITTSPNTTDPIIYRGVLNTSNGSSLPYAIQGPGTIGNTLYRTDTTPWTSLGTFNTGYATPQSVTAIDQDVIASGYEVPVIINSSGNFSRLTAAGGQTLPPGAKHIAFHLGSLWLWNTNPTTTSLDGTSSLRMSDPNNIASWPNASQTFISKDDGQVGMGLAEFTLAETGISPTQTLVAFKNYSGYQVTGVFGSSNFSIQKIKSDMGCTAPRTIQFVSGFGIIRLTHKGFALFNGVDDKLISEEVRPFVFGHDEIPALSFASIDRSWAVQSQNPPLYVAACPIGSSQLNRFFIYDLVRKAWTIADFPFNINCLSLFVTPSTQPIVHAGTSSAGQIVRLFAGDTTDNGSLIPWSFRTREFNIGDFMTNSYWRRIILDAAVAPPQTAKITATYLGLPTSQVANVSLTGIAIGTKWGTGTWGQFTWAGSTKVDARTTMDLLKVSPSVHFDVSGSGFITIRGLQVQGRSKPVSKAKI